MQNTKKSKHGESIIYIIVWLVVLLMPVFMSDAENGINWSRVYHDWYRFLPFLIVFLMHNYLLFPHFFIQRKRFLYFILTLVLIVVASLFSEFLGDLLQLTPNEPQGMQPPRRMQIPGQIPGPPGGPNAPGGKPFYRMIIDNALVSILVVGFNAAIKLTVKWQDEEQKNKELEKEKLQSELAFLKNQVSPHFFMNTLNNIHALIDIDTEDAKKSVIKLSKLMRYLLYDSDEGKTTLKKEIEFIRSYVELMKLRFTEKVKVSLSFPELVPDVAIPPMLFTSLVENSFKHGVSYQKDSFIKIILKIDANILWFRIKNSKHKTENGLEEVGGIGLENMKKRLQLLYNESYQLEKREDENNFEVIIKIPVNA